MCGPGKSDTRAVLGGGDGVYMSTDNLYVYYDSWRGSVSDSESYRRTGIVKFSAGGKLDLMGTAWIDGYVDGSSRSASSTATCGWLPRRNIP